MQGQPASPEEESSLIVLAKSCIDKEDFSEAETIYRLLIEKGVQQSKVFSNLALICGLDGRVSERLKLLEHAVALDEGHPEAWLNLGVAYQEDGRLDEAERCYQKAIELNEYLVSGYSNLSRLKFSKGAYEEAIVILEKGLALQPDHELMLMNYGLAMQLFGRADEAILHYLQAIALYPNNARLIFLIGRALDEIGETDQAIDLYRQAIELEHDDAEIHYHLGNSLVSKGDLDLAIQSYRLAVDLAPAIAEPAANLAMAYFKQGDLRRAVDGLKEVLQLHPQNLCTHQSLQFCYSVADVDSVSEAAIAAKKYWSVLREKTWSSQSSLCTPENNRTPGRIRVGILCAEIGVHCVSQFIESFLKHYDRTAFWVELISPSIRYQQRSEELAQLADSIVSLQGLHPSVARNRLRDRDYDILLETSGFTVNTAIDLLAERCAPVQCHYIGYHASTGLDTIDYFIGDQETIPAEFAWQFNETLWPLARPWLACTPFMPLPKAESHATRPGPLLGSFNQLTKVREETLAYWGAALMKLPESLLILKDRLTASALVRDRIETTLAGYGVDPNRLLYLPLTASWQEHMDCYNLIDIALDATPWSSATTGIDTLGMGVPLVAIRGEKTSARMSSSLVKAVGHSDWIADTPQAFAEIVFELGSDYLRHRENKASFQSQVLSGPLFDAGDLTSHLENAFRRMLDVPTTKNRPTPSLELA